jgi:hypothetical protein
MMANAAVDAGIAITGLQDYVGALSAGRDTSRASALNR